MDQFWCLTLAGGEGHGERLSASFPRTPPLISAFGLDFRPYGFHSAASQTVFIPQFLGVWIKHCTGALITKLYS